MQQLENSLNHVLDSITDQQAFENQIAYYVCAFLANSITGTDKFT